MSETLIHPPTLSPVLRAAARRSLRLSTRNVDAVITGLALPVMLMLMFVYLFGGAIGGSQHYVQYVVPGVLLVCVIFGAANTAVSVAADLNGGMIDRLRAMDVRGEALLNAHVLASLVRNLASTLLVIVVALAIGFRPHTSAIDCLAALSIVAAFVLALSWVAAAFGLLARSPEAASGMTFGISFLPYASSAFVPIRTMPGWLQVFARNQPCTAVADSVRALLTGGPVGASGWIAVGWSVGITAAAVVATGVLFNRRVR